MRGQYNIKIVIICLPYVVRFIVNQVCCVYQFCTVYHMVTFINYIFFCLRYHFELFLPNLVLYCYSRIICPNYMFINSIKTYETENVSQWRFVSDVGLPFALADFISSYLQG